MASIEEFHEHEKIRVLLIADELQVSVDLSGVQFIIHAELPEDKKVYIDRILTEPEKDSVETLALILATDFELPAVRKIEQAIGQRIMVAELPENLLIYTEPKEPAKKIQTHKAPKEEERGAAFHEKKASNAKDYNYSSGLKAKMNKKKKHG